MTFDDPVGSTGGQSQTTQRSELLLEIYADWVTISMRKPTNRITTLLLLEKDQNYFSVQCPMVGYHTHNR